MGPTLHLGAGRLWTHPPSWPRCPPCSWDGSERRGERGLVWGTLPRRAHDLFWTRYREGAELWAQDIPSSWEEMVEGPAESPDLQPQRLQPPPALTVLVAASREEVLVGLGPGWVSRSPRPLLGSVL